MGNTTKNRKMNKKYLNVIAILTMVAGAFGMMFCYQFLWSANMADLVGAGFPFVGGAILFGSGLLALAIFNRK